MKGKELVGKKAGRGEGMEVEGIGSRETRREMMERARTGKEVVGKKAGDEGMKIKGKG